MKISDNVLNHYLQTSMYTYLGPYEEFAKNLPDDIEKLCALQKMQTIHPQIFLMDPMIMQDNDNFYGDMTQIPIDRLNCEEDIFPTAISMFAELLRRDSNYSVNREAKNKIHILCRGNALMLASTLKAKNIPARVRVGWAKYHYNTGLCDDQWNVEYYDLETNQWIMVDSSGIGGNSTIPNKMINIPKDKFLTAADAWLGIRQGTLDKGTKIMVLDGHKNIQAAWIGLMNDFNCLMNNEYPVIFEPKYILVKEDKKWEQRGFTDKEFEELDLIAKLMQEPDKNLEKLQHIWNKKPKFKQLLGISSWN